MLVTLRGPGPRDRTPMASSNVSLAHDAAQVAALLDSPEITALIAELEATRWTGRPGYPLRAMVGLALIKSCTGSRPGRGRWRWSRTTQGCGTC
jgi:hypothetical protein